MDGGDAELGPDQGAGDRRIDVADHDQPVRPVRLGDRAIGDHHLAGLLGMAARADAEVEIGLGQAEIGEEIGRHVGVVMLAGMDEDRRMVAARLQRVPERGHLHEIGPRRGDQMNLAYGQIGLPAAALDWKPARVNLVATRRAY